MRLYNHSPYNNKEAACVAIQMSKSCVLKLSFVNL